MNDDDRKNELLARMDELQARLTAPGSNYFTLLGLTLAATQKEIESAYRRLAEELSSERLDLLGAGEAARKGRALARQLQRAYQVLSDYGQRGEYEKRGYKEFVAPDVKDDPVEFAKGLYRKALTLFNQKNHRMAIQVVEDAIRYNPAKADYYLLLGLCQSELPTMKRQAEQSLGQAVALEPWNAEHVVALGMLFYSERLLNRAEGFFRKALELEPKHELALKKLAEITGPEKNIAQQLKERGEKLLRGIFPSLFRRRQR